MILSFWFVGRKPQRNVEPYKICIFSVVDVERVVVAVDEVEALARVGQPYTAVLLGALLVLRVLAGEQQPPVGNMRRDVDEAPVLIAHPVLEGVLDVGDGNERSYEGIGQIVVAVGLYVDLVGIAQPHELYVVVDEVALLPQTRQRTVAVVENVAHEVRQLNDTLLGLLGVDVDQRMDIVEGVHEEVRVYLKFQIFQLLVQVLVHEPLEFLLVLVLLEEQFHAEVHAEHQDENDDADEVDLIDEERSVVRPRRRQGSRLGVVDHLGVVLMEVMRPWRSDVELVDAESDNDDGDEAEV